MNRQSGDTLRLTATFAVLCIHSAGAFEPALVEGGGGGWQAYLAGTLSQVSRFCVPMFMILSGYGLAASRIKRGEGGVAGALAMWRRQFLRIGVPYLAFTVAGLAVHKRLDPMSLLTALGTGRGDYHLYFCSFLLQTYLVLPLLFRVNWIGVGALFLVQLALGRPGVEMGMPHLPAFWCVHWLGYAALGCRLARVDAEGKKEPGGSALWSAIAAIGAVLCVVEYFLRVRHVPDAGWANHFFRAPVMVYTLAFLLAWRAVQPVWFGRWLGKLTALSFCVYLIHPTVLRGLRATPIADWFPVVFPVLVVASFGAAWVLDRVIRWRWGRLPLGL